MPVVERLAVPRRILKELEKASKQASHEVAALLFGRLEGTRAVASRAEFLELSERSPAYFIADPEHVYKLYVEADARGEELVAVFHSHLTPPIPSSTDLRFMKLNPVAWLIYSTGTGEWGAYQLVGGEVREVKLDIC